MIIAGLTGSIGMGKSTTGQFFAELGAYLYDADKTVHQLYAGRAVEPIEQQFPGTNVNGKIDRIKLSQYVIDHPDAMKALEAIIHPMVRSEEEFHRKQAETNGFPVMVLDIPLLFETASLHHFDKIIVVSADTHIQKERVLARPGMTEEKFLSLLNNQISDKEKRKLADYVIDTSKGLEDAFRQVKVVMNQLVAANQMAASNA